MDRDYLSVLYLSRKALQRSCRQRTARARFRFQSSTYRGRHCNCDLRVLGRCHGTDFQSSTYRGRHCNRRSSRREAVGWSCLSVLYLSRKALQPRLAVFWGAVPHAAFSPLLIEEGTATSFPTPTIRSIRDPFSPLLIEEGTATRVRRRTHGTSRNFQSSTYRGRHCNPAWHR